MLPVFAASQPSSWAAAIQTELQRIGGVAANAPRGVMHRWLQHAKHPICSLKLSPKTPTFCGSILNGSRDHTYIPSFTGNRRGLARCGHHDFSDGRSARHRHDLRARAGCNNLMALPRCRYTGSSAPTPVSNIHMFAKLRAAGRMRILITCRVEPLK